MAAQLQHEMDRLSLIESPSIPILSVYLNLAPERVERRSIGARLRDLLDPLDKLAASGELDHESSMSLRAGIARVLDLEGALAADLGKGVGLFVCDRLGLDEHVTMPRRAWDCAVAGPRPYLRPIQAILDAYRRLAVVILDGRDARITMTHMGEVLGQELIEGEELRKTDLAGWHGLEEMRHRRHAEEARNRVFREVAEHLDRLRRDSGLEAVFVGGQDEVTHALLPFLDRRLQQITETFVIDVNTLTPASLAAKVDQLEQELEHREEVTEVEAIYASAAAGGPAVIGVDRVLQAVNRHAVARLLIHDTAAISGAVCSNCGALWLPSASCLECGMATNTVTDLLEPLARSVVDAGGSVEHVMASTMLAADLVAARVRFVTR